MEEKSKLILKRDRYKVLATGCAFVFAFALISFLISISLVFEGGHGYFRYRKMIYDQRIKKEEVTKENSKECPTNEKIIPVVDDMPQDSSIVS